MEILSRSDIQTAAKSVLGWKIVRNLDNGKILSGSIVETEVYHQEDEASHTFGGKMSKRNQVMFGPAARAYVYFTYGMHYCMNITAGPDGYGAAILIRGLEPLDGVETMKVNRRQDDIYQLCSGPAKLTQALMIDTALNGHDLAKPPLQLIPAGKVGESDIVTTTRIGISKAIDQPLRFYIKNNPYISKP
ncbi:MAG: DNA-3-methyladenine glycosylase [Candidatus Saccharimonadales bacterium]